MIWLNTGNERWYKMQPVSVTGIETTYISGALQRGIDFRSCKTFISIDGVVRTTLGHSFGIKCNSKKTQQLVKNLINDKSSRED
jgi:hypothetical protein